MADSILRRAACVFAGLAALAIVAVPSPAQVGTKTNVAKADVIGVGKITGATAVVAGNRDNGGNIFASTTATVTDNGNYALQAKLTVPFTDKVKPSIVNDVQGLNPLTNTYQSLSTTTWVTVAIGPSGLNRFNTIQLFVIWGKSSSKDPKQIPDIQITYQVIPR